MRGYLLRRHEGPSRAWRKEFVMSSERERDVLNEALRTALDENRLLRQEINLLHAQLRRHPSGELQIRQARRQLASRPPFDSPEGPPPL
jgi:hypothetical protein